MPGIHHNHPASNWARTTGSVGVVCPVSLAAHSYVVSVLCGALVRFADEGCGTGLIFPGEFHTCYDDTINSTVSLFDVFVSERGGGLLNPKSPGMSFVFYNIIRYTPR